MKQLVLSGNRVLAHGEDCFLATCGGVVVCTDTGRIFENATVATYDCDCPGDIDEREYEFLAGRFVSCGEKRWVTLADVRPTETGSVPSVTIPLSESLKKYSQFAVLTFHGCTSGTSNDYTTYTGEIQIEGVTISPYTGEIYSGKGASASEETYKKHTRFSTRFFPVIYTPDARNTIISTSESNIGINVSGELKEISIVFSGNARIYSGAIFIVIAR